MKLTVNQIKQIINESLSESTKDSALKDFKVPKGVKLGEKFTTSGKRNAVVYQVKESVPKGGVDGSKFEKGIQAIEEKYSGKAKKLGGFSKINTRFDDPASPNFILVMGDKASLDEAAYDVPSRRDAAMAAARAEIERKYGAGSIVDTGAGEQLSNDWMRFVMRHPRYQDILLDAWDHMVQGDNPSDVKRLYLNDLDGDIRIAGAITYYGRRIRQGEKYHSGAELAEKIKAERAEREAERSKPKPAQPFKRPKYGMGTYTDPETGEKVHWTGTHEKFN